MNKLELLDRARYILINQDNLTIRFNDDYFIKIEIRTWDYDEERVWDYDERAWGCNFELICNKEQKVDIYIDPYRRLKRKVYATVHKDYKIKNNAIKTAIKFVDSNITNDDIISEVK